MESVCSYRKQLVLCILFGILFTCKKKNKELTDIDISLEVTSNESPFRNSLSPLRYVDSIQKFDGLPEGDSLVVMTFNTISNKEIERLSDHQKEHLKSLRKELYVVSGFKDSMQFYIPDLNNNKSFEDDNQVFFTKEIALETYQNTGLIDTFPKIKFKAFKVYDTLLVESENTVVIYPDQQYYTLGKNKELLLNKRDKPFLQSKTNDYLMGYFKLKNRYKLALSYDIFGETILIRHADSAFFPIPNSNREEYRMLDTVELEGALYQISKFMPPFNIVMQNLDTPPSEYGFRKGKKIKNYSIENVYGDSVKISSLFEGKQLILLDFWGTWCGPCKALTPKLVELNAANAEKFNMVSIAYQPDTESIIDYASKNGMDWFNGIIKGEPKSKATHPLLKELRIESYPTFVLLDSNLKIIFRGTGSNFDELTSLINGL